MVEARQCRYGRGVRVLEDGNALVRLLRLNLDCHYSREHIASLSEPASPDRSTLTAMMPATNIRRRGNHLRPLQPPQLYCHVASVGLIMLTSRSI
jgi:hypothetical protein